MNQIEKALSDYLGEMCGMRLKPHALTGLAKAAIAAMPVQAEPVAWMYTYTVQYQPKLECTKKLAPVISLSLARWENVVKPWTETPLYAHPPAQWQGIESAPRDGTSILVWRDDWDEPVMARWVCCYDFLTETECDASGMGDEALARHDWFCADYANGCRLETDQSPTHWMPLPTPPAGGSDAE